MNDEYRISEPPAQTARSPLRVALWLVLVLSAAANMVFSSVVDRPWVGSIFGLVTLACAATLVVHHYRNR
jgi:hypothetical protein